jgi:peptide/nickel transport system permease protein
MGRYIIRRVLQMIPTVFGVILITFILFNLVGGSPALMVLGRHVSPQALEEFDEVRGFNKPLLFGWWSGTRTYDDTLFDRHAGPWRQVEGVAYVAASNREPAFVRFPAGSYAAPLNFTPRAETGFRWVMEYRLSGVADAAWQYGDTNQPDRIVVPATAAWQTHTARFESGATPESLAMQLMVPEGGVLELAALRMERRADAPWDSQFVFYLGQILRGDLGYSESMNQPISQMIRQGAGPSLMLTVPIFVIGLVVAISLSLVCAFYRNRWIDRTLVVVSVALMSINYLVWIVVGQYLTAYRWGWFPVWGFESWTYLLLPISIGVISGLGSDVRFYRTVMLDEMYKEYVRTAFAKGVSQRGVLFKHVLKNAMITVTTNVVIAIPFLYTGSLLLESFFGIPGLGYMAINAIMSSDVDVIRAIVLIGAVLYVIANLLTDICYAWVDPRVKLQ